MKYSLAGLVATGERKPVNSKVGRSGTLITGTGVVSVEVVVEVLSVVNLLSSSLM